MELNCKDFKLAKINFYFQQMDMIYPVTSCLMAVVALIFGIYLINSMYCDWYFICLGTEIFSKRWNLLLLYNWLINMELNYYLVIFTFFSCSVCFCYFFNFSKKILINNSYWANPVTSCLMVVVAIGIGIGICFFYFQRDNICYYYCLRQYLSFTNTRLECFCDLFICYMCFICENFGFLFCFYFFKLCKKVKGWIIYRVGIKKKKER